MGLNESHKSVKSCQAALRVWSFAITLYWLVDATFKSEVIYAAMKATAGNSRQSAYLLQQAVLAFYTECRLFPPGVVAELPCVQTWSLRIGVAVKRMVACP